MQALWIWKCEAKSLLLCISMFWQVSERKVIFIKYTFTHIHTCMHIKIWFAEGNVEIGTYQLKSTRLLTSELPLSMVLFYGNLCFSPPWFVFYSYNSTYENKDNISFQLKSNMFGFQTIVSVLEFKSLLWNSKLNNDFFVLVIICLLADFQCF